MTHHHEWILFDGALLHEAPQHAHLMAHGQHRALYDDLGEQASAVGPILLPSDQEAASIVKSLSGPMRFAAAGLTCHVSVEPLVQHLRAIRYLHAGERAYYFRYADNRALAAVTPTLMPEQLRALLGPIEAWHFIARDGRKAVVRADAHAKPASLPLQLQPEQWHRILTATRIGELYDVTQSLAADTQPPCLGDDAQRYAWTVEAHRLLTNSNITRPDIRALANRVIWQSGGHLLRDSVFRADLPRAEAPGGIDLLLRYERAYEGYR